MILRIVRYTLTQPITSFNQAKMAIYQYHFSRIRKNKSNADISIPPFMIYSITKSCNLNCKGCYAKVNQTLMGEELNMDEVKSIFRQCQQLGIGIIMLAGGEPFTKMDVINLCKSFPKLLFPIFTNGLLLSSDIIRNLSHNVIPVLSIEGNQQQTDSRRGDDVYQSIKSRFKQLHMSKRFWGVSITVTSQNLKEVLSDDFILKLIRHGCKLFFFVEYVPVIENTDHLILSAEDKESLVMRTDIFSEKYSSLFIAFPGDEEKWGGCLAAGRGFVHIQADGSMEPCPFAPYSDVSLKDVTLEKALASSFLAKIKKKHHLLHETKGGCALWENRELVKQILDSDS
jgi:MoaA/NifB/PqqE/SkfB family radical SAM enzyme